MLGLIADPCLIKKMIVLKKPGTMEIDRGLTIEPLLRAVHAIQAIN
jgi:hypothetical protein